MNKREYAVNLIKDGFNNEEFKIEMKKVFPTSNEKNILWYYNTACRDLGINKRAKRQAYNKSNDMIRSREESWAIILGKEIENLKDESENLKVEDENLKVEDENLKVEEYTIEKQEAKRRNLAKIQEVLMANKAKLIANREANFDFDGMPEPYEDDDMILDASEIDIEAH